MELRQLQCFVTCVQSKSFSKAASLLYTSQSNVSKTIAALENELGKKLFERKQNGIEVTEKGKQIYSHAISMIEQSSMIYECMNSEDFEELKIVYESNDWFAKAFTEYYLQEGQEGKRYQVMNATFEEMILRIENNQEQLGFAYISRSQLGKMQDVFRSNHIGYYILTKSDLMLYYGNKWDPEDHSELLLIQKTRKLPFRISRQSKNPEEEPQTKTGKVIITTNSDEILQEILTQTELVSIRPENLPSMPDHTYQSVQWNDSENEEFLFLCIFRNDKTLERISKHFLNFIRFYIKREQERSGS